MDAAPPVLERIKCTAYIDEAGDLGINRGTRWFILTAVLVDNDCETQIRNVLAQCKERLNVREIHLRRIQDFNRRAYIVNELKKESFTYINIVIDTSKLQLSSVDLIYNFACKMLLERVSWYLHEANRECDVVLSARGSSRDAELIEYITEKLLPYKANSIDARYFKKISAKAASSWDMLQLADVCATTMFLSYEVNGWGFRLPCFSKALASHIYKRNGSIVNSGIKYLTADMKPSRSELACDWICT